MKDIKVWFSLWYPECSYGRNRLCSNEGNQEVRVRFDIVLIQNYCMCTWLMSLCLSWINDNAKQITLEEKLWTTGKVPVVCTVEWQKMICRKWKTISYVILLMVCRLNLCVFCDLVLWMNPSGQYYCMARNRKLGYDKKVVMMKVGKANDFLSSWMTVSIMKVHCSFNESGCRWLQFAINE